MKERTKGILLSVGGLSTGPIIGVMCDHLHGLGLLIGSCASVGLLGIGLLVIGVCKMDT